MSEWASHPSPLRYNVAPRAGRDKFWNAERRHRLHHFDSLDGPVFTEAKKFHRGQTLPKRVENT